jgi:hypothetical protein
MNRVVGPCSCAVHELLEGGFVNNHHLAETGSKIALHTLALLGGLVLVITGLGLCVTMVGLPLGLPIGLTGVLVCLWGLFGTTARKTASPPRP